MPLSIEAMALVVASRHSSEREGIVNGAFSLLQTPEADKTVLSAHLSNLIDLKVFRLEDNSVYLTKRGATSMVAASKLLDRLMLGCR